MFSYGDYPVKFETKQIRWAANCIGAAYAFIFGLRLFIENFSHWNASFAKLMSTVAENEIYLSVFQIITSILMFIPPYLALSFALGGPIFFLNFRKPRKGTALPLIFIGLSVCQIAEILTNLFASSMYSIGIEPKMHTINYGNGFYGVALAILSTAVVPALCEEFAMRGIVMGSLRQHGDGFAILCSAIVFGMMHRNLLQTPFAFVVGLGLGFIAVSGESLYLAVAVHFMNNLISVGFYYLNAHLDTAMQNVVYCCYAIIMLALGALGIFLCKDTRDLFYLEPPEGKCSFARRIGAFFSAPMMIIVILLTAIEIFNIQVG